MRRLWPTLHAQWRDDESATIRAVSVGLVPELAVRESWYLPYQQDRLLWQLQLLSPAGVEWWVEPRG